MIRRARLRLTLWYSAVLLVLLLLLSTVTYTAVTRTLARELEEGISSAVGQWLEAPRRAPLARPGGGPEPRANLPRPGQAGSPSATPELTPAGTAATETATPSPSAATPVTGTARDAGPKSRALDPRLIPPPPPPTALLRSPTRGRPATSSSSRTAQTASSR